MALAKPLAERAPSEKAAPSEVDIRPLFAPIDDILASGGDARLQLSRPVRQNMYGCTPYPRPDLIDFASSTASSISQEAHGRVLAAREEYLARVIRDGARTAFEDVIADVRQSLLAQLDLQHAGSEIVFAASGTDAQIHALFLAKSLLGTPLTTIIAGSDQTGSGTAYTSRGQHFSDSTAGGQDGGKGRCIAGLADRVRNINVPFHMDGAFRTPAEMDDAVTRAVETAVTQGSRILLQVMDASKFGWRAPSDGRVDEIAKRWPGRVQVIVDACQMRISAERLKEALAKGFLVLVTGSKFFTGPAFSGALLVPKTLCARIARISCVPAGLAAYASAFDWPRAWPALRSQFPVRANYGQWLRWEAALEEMRLYHAVPGDFRTEVRASLASHIERLVESSPHLRLLRFGDEPGQARNDTTMFPVLPHRDGVPLSGAQCAAVYRALRRDLSGIARHEDDDAQARAARAVCQVGQPVPLPEPEGAALRISLSARTIRQCWSGERTGAQPGMERMLADIATLFEKLNFAIGRIDDIEAPAP